MPIRHESGVGTLRGRRPEPLTALTTAAHATEILEDALLTLDQMSTRLTVLALNASRTPEQSVRVRALLSGLLEAIQDCESDLGTYLPTERAAGFCPLGVGSSQ